MSKGLECLQKVFDDILENDNVIKYYAYDTTEIKTIKQELKVLEIIKKKQVNVRALLRSFSLDYGLELYNLYQADYKKELYNNDLTKEEYDLLKEVLL